MGAISKGYGYHADAMSTACALDQRSPIGKHAREYAMGAISKGYGYHADAMSTACALDQRSPNREARRVCAAVSAVCPSPTFPSVLGDQSSKNRSFARKFN